MTAREDDETIGTGTPAGGEAAPHPFAGVVLGIGAPAAETGSLVRVLAGLPPDAGMAVVLALQHREALDEPGFARALGERAGALAAVVDGASPEAGRVYLPAPGQIVTLEEGRFKTRPVERGPSGRATIDSLLVSLARDEDGKSIGLVLAGTGGDGTLGIAAIRDADGFALAEAADEDGEAADTDAGTPAAPSGPAALADLVLPADRLAGRIALHARHLAREDKAAKIDAQAAAVSDALGRIADVLRERTGHDFHGYKRPTFMRRVQRRMQVVDADTVQDYLRVLHVRPDEAQQLFNDLLIGVTRFFRDRREFEFLRAHIIPALFEGKGRDDRLRVWVLGCSTGEEAYSIAILLREFAATLDAPPGLQVFATDLDARSLAAARVGRYAGTIAQDVSPERLERWFIKEGDTYRTVRELREICIFSQHSLIKDTPFSRLDLVSCRNVLIYLGTELQDRVIPMFHFTLNPGGYLFLGNSENVSRHARLFVPVDRGLRIFRKVDTGARAPLDFPPTPAPRLASPLAPARARGGAQDVVRRAEYVAERYAPAYAVVDERFDALHFSPNAGRFIHPSGGAASLNLPGLVHADLRPELEAALVEAARDDRPVQVHGVRVGMDGRRAAVDLLVEPVRDASGEPRSFVVLFKDGLVLPDAGEAAPSDERDERVRHLEAELRQTRERWQAAIEELESTNEELKASNEEYQSLNEELQSANEELATSKEELQSLNEELTTVNHELAQRVQELDRANSDMKNLLESTQIATVFLDTGLRVMNFTPAASEVFHFGEADIGRPIGHIKPRVAYEGLQDDVRRVLRTLGTVEREVEVPGTGARYMARVLPYRSVDDVIAGTVVTFTDLTALTRAQRALRESEERFRALVSATSDVMYRMSPDWAEMRRLDGYGLLSDTPAPSRTWMEEYIHPEDRPRVAAAIQEAVRTKGVFELEHRVRLADGSPGWTLSRAVPLLGPDGEIAEWFGTASDVTARKQAEEALRESEGRFRTLADLSPDGILLQVDGAVGYANLAAARLLGAGSPDELRDRSPIDLVLPASREVTRGRLADAVRGGYPPPQEVGVRRLDGAEIAVEIVAGPVRWRGKPAVQVLLRDLSERKKAQARQKLLLAELQHRVRNTLAVVRSIARRTAETSDTVEGYAAHLEGRISAFARTQSMVTRSVDAGVDLEELVRDELLAHAARDETQVHVEGPRLRLGPKAAEVLGLAVHELATNAVKYGALRGSGGRVGVVWRVEGVDGGRVLDLVWQESGVCPPEAARRHGFGTELIERTLRYELDARAGLEFTPDGVRCAITVPLTDRILAGGGSAERLGADTGVTTVDRPGEG